MPPKVSKADKKIAYDQKLCNLLDDYSQVLIAAADNVGSNQLQNIRQGFRGDSVVLMGKNTMMKRSIRIRAEKTGNNAILNLIPLLVGNVGLVFTKRDLKEVKSVRKLPSTRFEHLLLLVWWLLLMSLSHLVTLVLIHRKFPSSNAEHMLFAIERISKFSGIWQFSKSRHIYHC